MKVITKDKVGHSFKTNNDKIVTVLRAGKYTSGMYQCEIVYSNSYTSWVEKFYYYDNGRACGKRGNWNFKEWVDEQD